jgi:uncharacterized protein YbcV (DUF1398 family)
MSKAIKNLKSARQLAIADRPEVGGFPYLAEALRRADVMSNLWSLPACQSLYLTEEGPVMMQGTPLFAGMADVPPFDRDALMFALRADQAGESTFPKFSMAAWKAGVVSYNVDLIARTVSYYGSAKESYVESYPAAKV